MDSFVLCVDNTISLEWPCWSKFGSVEFVLKARVINWNYRQVKPGLADTRSLIHHVGESDDVSGNATDMNQFHVTRNQPIKRGV